MRRTDELANLIPVLFILAFSVAPAMYLFPFEWGMMEMSISELWRMLGLKSIGLIFIVVGIVVWLFGKFMVMIQRLSGKDPSDASGRQSAKRSHVIDLDRAFSTSSIFKRLKTMSSKPTTIKFGGMSVVLDSEGGKTEVISDSDSSSRQVIDIDGSKQVIEFEGGKVILDGDVQNITKEVKVYSVTHRSNNDDD